MLDTLKAALVTLLVLFIFFVGGVLVGLKLPETALYQRWTGETQTASVIPQDTRINRARIPDTQRFENSSNSSLHGSNSTSGTDQCVGGVCKLPVTGKKSHHRVSVSEPPTENVNLTFYSELGDHPKEKIARQNSSDLQVKTAPVVKKRKHTSVKSAKLAKTANSSKLWELRICSLPVEIKARIERSKLIKKYPKIKIEPVQVAGKGTWYRVKISNIMDRKVAERYKQELSRKYHYKPIIRQQ